jgi:hypothetical protein
MSSSPLLSFLFRHGCIGVGIGWGLLAWILLSGDVRTGNLVLAAGWLPVAMLMVVFAITFASAAIGIAMMTLRYGADEPKQPGPPRGHLQPIPLPVRAKKPGAR